MAAPIIQIESMVYDEAAEGWTVHAQILGGEGSTRTGPQFVELSNTATADQIRTALEAMYPTP